MHKAKSGTLAMVLILIGTMVHADGAHADGTAADGAQKIKTFGCITCHGRDGVSKLPEAPNLAGQVQIYLTSALQAYRAGARKNEMMNTVAEKLSDADVADLAAYYSSIAVSVTPPPKP
jgi:cytochrome c553